MRLVIALVVLPLVTHARVCGTNPTPDVVVDAKGTNVVPPAIPATHGGQIVYAGTVPIEVVVKGSGTVQAYPVATIPGQPPALPQSARVTVQVPVVGGPPKDVRLAWRGPDAYFVGQVPGAVVAPGPVSVVVQADGQRYATIAPVYVTPVFATTPSAVVVQAPSAAVVVQPPSASVVVGAPAIGVLGPRANVVVGAPAIDVEVNAPGIVVAPPIVGVAPRPGVVFVDDDDGYRGYRRGGDWDDDRGRRGGDWDDGRGRGRGEGRGRGDRD